MSGESFGLANIGGSDRVAVILPPGAEAAVATLAIAAHAACAPLNPAYSAREFELLPFVACAPRPCSCSHGTSSACDRRCEVAQSADLVPPAGNKSPAGIFSLVNDGKVDRNYQGPAAASGPALLLFTSGTTARPKLAPLTHRQLCLSADNIGSALQLEPPTDAWE